MTSLISQSQIAQVVSDGVLTGEESLGLVSHYLNGSSSEARLPDLAPGKWIP
jgi:hypothetical protein